MFLGVSKARWIASGVAIVAGLALFLSGVWGIASGILGIVLVFLGILLFGMTPKHHQEKPDAIPSPPPAPRAPSPPAPRPEIEARDASEV